jgi:hypothetical protein
MHRRQLLTERQPVDEDTVGVDENIWRHVERLRSGFERVEHGLDIVGTAYR